jgi:hypothetical protein
VAPFEQADRGHVAEVPGKFGYLRDIGLHPEYRFIRIDTEREQVDDRLMSKRRHLVAAGHRSQTVHVGDKAEKLAARLGFDHGLDHAQIIADMQGA